MCSETSLQHGCVMWCKSAELNVFGYAGRSALRLHISRRLSFICHISLAFISPDRLHTTLKPVIVYGSGLHKSNPSTRTHTCIHAHSNRHVPTLPPSPCHPTSGLHLSFTRVSMATWFAPLAAKEAESMMGNKRQRERIWTDNSGIKSYCGEVNGNYSRARLGCLDLCVCQRQVWWRGCILASVCQRLPVDNLPWLLVSLWCITLFFNSFFNLFLSKGAQW